MNKKLIIIFVVILGLAALFFFPEPETNFLAYLGTIILFVGVIIFLIKRNKNR